MPVEGRRSIAICRQCNSALAVHILAEGSVRPIGTGRYCSCGGDSFEIVGDLETEADDEGDVTVDSVADSGDEQPYPNR